MTILLSHVLTLPTILVGLLLFGFAPGAALRIIVLAFKKDDPRRRELLGELRNVPRFERPFWVAEQIEVALIEGLGHRLLKAIKRLNLGQRLAKWWRDFKYDFWHARYTLGSSLATYSFAGSLVYMCMLLPGVSKVVAMVSWVLVGCVRASLQKRYVKRCEQAGESVKTIRFDVAMFIALGPAVYATTTYMLIHDLIALISGHLGPTYWTGLFLTLLAIWYPWELTLDTKRAMRTEDTAPLHPSN